MGLPPIAEVLRLLTAHEISSVELTERCLRTIADPLGEGSRTFLRVYTSSALQEAAAADKLRQQGKSDGSLLGLPISIKDLFDVAGETTTAGSMVLMQAPAAQIDACVVRRLKRAGAVLIGRTSMTEFAYSGLGLNPHFGTPRNPFDRVTGRIPGGSSSGAAVSVSDGMAVAGIGSDTGGSVRIPAALCGLTGFKPTADRVSRTGMLPLSPSLDSIGSIARSVDCCERLDAVLAGKAFRAKEQLQLRSLRFGVMQGYVLEGLDTQVSGAFLRATAILLASGATIEPLEFPEIERVPSANQFAAAEAYVWHRSLLKRAGDRYDPHVSGRIRQGASLLAADYLDMMRVRSQIIGAAKKAFRGFDAILLPTTPRVAPALQDVESSDTTYFDVNGAMLRNPSLINFLNGCAISLPCHAEGEAPVGLMVAGLSGWDASLFRVGRSIEMALASLREGSKESGPA